MREEDKDVSVMRLLFCPVPRVLEGDLKTVNLMLGVYIALTLLYLLSR